jgi:hypothetical protein
VDYGESFVNPVTAMHSVGQVVAALPVILILVAKPASSGDLNRQAST